MKRLLLKLFIFTVFSVLTAVSAYSQLRVVTYSENFVAGTTYCPGTSNYDKWVSFRAALDTNTIKFQSVTISGDNNATAVTGRTCSDAINTRRLAAAIKNGTAYNVTCGSFTWDIGGAGTCVVGGGCAVATDQVAISVNGAGTFCNCANPAWSLNACIGNANWGGIATPNCPPPTQRITLQFIRPGVARDMGCTGINPLDQCAYTQNIFARFSSGAPANIDSFEYYVRINTTTYGPYKSRVTLRPDSSRTIQVYNNFTFTRNTMYTIRVWSANPNNAADGDVKNDTFTREFDFRGTLGTPDTKDTILCGSQRTTLRATPADVRDSLVWFADRGATNVVGYGRRVQSPFLISGGKYKFFVGSYNGLNVVRVNIGGGTNGQNGAMFNILANSGDLKIDSMYFQCWSTPGTAEPCDVYLRTGSYLDPGAASTASMWTKVWSGNVTSKGNGTYTTHIPVTYTLRKGVQYAVYVNTPAATLGYATGGATINNGDITIVGGYGIAGTFGGTFSPRTYNGAVFYTKPICPSALDSAEVTVNPAPWGALMVPGTPHKTSPKRSGTGALGSPRVVAMGDTLAWYLSAPVGYNNADHGTTWRITSTSLRTAKGRALTYSWTDPSATAPGRFVYTPTTTEIDSQLVGRVTFQDIGKNNCDSTVVFYMYVAPLPEPDFTRSKVTCEGDAVEFVNKSKIANGFLDHMWYFGDGDSSEASEPVHFYPKGGIYYVTYKAISSIYGYERIKRDTITVSPLPNVNFRILNVCEGKTHQFINTSSGLGTLTYKWNFGVTPGVNATSKDATFKYGKPGQYNVTLTVEDNGCPATRTKTAYLFHTPVSDFTYPKTPGLKFCSNVPVEFTNKSTLGSGILGQMWSFGDGEVGTVKNPVHLFKAGGNYTVRLISISEFGCADTTTDKIDIGSAPVVAWSNGQVCDQTPTQFTNNTAAISGFASAPKWSFGDGNTSTANSPTHQFTTLGPKTVKLIVSVTNGCSDSLTKTLNVGTQAIADFSAQSTCSGKPVQFDNKSSVKQGNMVYEWDFGDGTPLSSDADPIHTYNVTNSFVPNVKLKVIVDGACETIITKPLQVYELPSCNFTVTDDWTPGDGYRTIKVQAANTGYPFYRFKFSDGGSINAASGVYQFPYEGDFDITLYTRNQADCECSKTVVKSIRNSMGTTKIGEGDIKLYPNPSNGLVNVEASSRIQKIAVYNVLGEEVEAGLNLKGKQAELRMQNLTEGVYLVKITTEQGVVTRSVSINR
jgi:PKD repeat protein